MTEPDLAALREQMLAAGITAVHIDYSVDPPSVTFDQGDVPMAKQEIVLQMTATASVTHANGRVCDEDCEAHGHYRDDQGNYYEEAV